LQQLGELDLWDRNWSIAAVRRVRFVG